MQRLPSRTPPGHSSPLVARSRTAAADGRWTHSVDHPGRSTLSSKLPFSLPCRREVAAMLRSVPGDPAPELQRRSDARGARSSSGAPPRWRSATLLAPLLGALAALPLGIARPVQAQAVPAAPAPSPGLVPPPGSPTPLLSGLDPAEAAF